MRVDNLQKYISDGKAVISADIEFSSYARPRTIFFAYPEKYYDCLPDSADPFFAAVLMPAMIGGQPLAVGGGLSARIMKNQAVIQDIFSVWYPERFSKIKVLAAEATPQAFMAEPGNATFFSLGVDSMYTMLKYLPQNRPDPDKQLTSLVYMKGLELPLSHYAAGQDQEVIRSVQRVAAHYNLEVIAGETNIRDVFSLSWEDYYAGPGLAASALSLSGGFKHFFIPSTHSYAVFFLLPSSPLTDHLWSNELMEISHDGSEKERVGKIADMIVQDDFALQNLRVCVSNNGGDYNCGKCWKCIRTMISLEILGRLETSGCFPEKLPRNFSAELRTYDPISLEFNRENLKLATLLGNKNLKEKLEREIRLGSLDVYRNGKPMAGFLKEILSYLYLKMVKRTGLAD